MYPLVVEELFSSGFFSLASIGKYGYAVFNQIICCCRLSFGTGDVMQGRRLLFGGRALLIVGTLGISACHITLLTDYDDVFDQEATNTQKDIDALFQKIISNPDRSNSALSAENPAEDKDAYAKIKTELDAMEVRAKAHDHNEGTISSVGKIENSFSLVEKAYENNEHIKIADANEKLTIMNQEFTALIKEELLKKQGNSGAK